MAAWMYLRIFSLIKWSVCECSLIFISKACILFSNPATKVHDSRAYRTMEMPNERISVTFDPYLQNGFSFVRAEVACAIRERTFFLAIVRDNCLRYLKFVSVSSICTFSLISLWMPLSLFVIRLFFSALIFILYPCAGFAETLNKGV